MVELLCDLGKFYKWLFNSSSIKFNYEISEWVRRTNFTYEIIIENHIFNRIISPVYDFVYNENFIYLDNKVILYDDMNNIKFDSSRSESLKKRDFIYNFLSSLRQKINDPLGVRKKKREKGTK